jgi:SAM-dependent methyltransferase
VSYWTPRAKVLEVGGLNVNGCSRDIAAATGATYFSVDMQAGPNVDEVMGVEKLTERFFAQDFDVVISTEMLEHVNDWRVAVYNMLYVLKVGGIFVMTTRSEGFPFHEYPIDTFRFSTDNLHAIFSPICTVLNLGLDDPEMGGPGCGIIARKLENGMPMKQWQTYLTTIEIYDIREHR